MADRPDPAARSGSLDSTPASTDTAVCRVFADVLEFDHLTLSDDFYALGGDSLQAVRVLLELERRFGVRVPDQVVEGMTSIGEVAAWVARAVADRPDGEVSRAEAC